MRLITADISSENQKLERKLEPVRNERHYELKITHKKAF